MGLLRRCYQKIKRFGNVVRSKDFYTSLDLHLPSKEFGEPGASWVVASEMIDDQCCVYSLGLGHDISFDLGLINEFGVTVHGFDPTPKSIAWLKTLELPDAFNFHDYGVAEYDGEANFRVPVNENFVSFTMNEKLNSSHKDDSVPLQVKRLSTIVNQPGMSAPDILKMDIEGAEYAVLRDLIASDIRPKQLLVEFHHVQHDIPASETKQVVKQLRECGYKIFYIAPTGGEYSFLHDN